MSRSREKYFKIANEVLAYIKQTVRSSNDIIPQATLPDYNLFNNLMYLSQLKEENKKQKFIELIKYQNEFNPIRNKIHEEAASILKKYPVTAAYVTTAIETGMGECGENSNLAVHKLIEAGMQKNTLVIGVVNQADETKNHAFVIICNETQNDSNIVGYNISALKSFDDDAVLLDPFLNVVIQANQYEKSEKFMDYLKAFRTTHIMTVTSCKDITDENGNEFKKECETLKQHLIAKKYLAPSPKKPSQIENERICIEPLKDEKTYWSLTLDAYAPAEEKIKPQNENALKLIYQNQSPFHDYEKEEDKKKFKKQMGFLIDAIDARYRQICADEKEPPSKEVDFIKNLNTRLFEEKVTNDQKESYFRRIKSNLETIYLVMQDGKVGNSRKLSALNQLIPGLNVCGPGIFSHIEAAAGEMSTDISLKNWLALQRTTIIKFLANEYFLEKKVGNGDHVHVINAFLEYATIECGYAPKTDLQDMNEHFMHGDKIKLDDDTKLKFQRTFEKKYNISLIADFLSDQFFSTWREQCILVEDKESWVDASFGLEVANSILKKLGAESLIRSFDVSGKGDKIKFNVDKFKQLFFHYCKEKNLFVPKVLWKKTPIDKLNSLINICDSQFQHVGCFEDKDQNIIFLEDLPPEAKVNYFYNSWLFNQNNRLRLRSTFDINHLCVDELCYLVKKMKINNDIVTNENLFIDMLEESEPKNFVESLLVINDFQTIVCLFNKINIPYVIYNSNHPWNEKITSILKMLKERNNDLVKSLASYISNLIRNRDDFLSENKENKRENIRYSDLINKSEDKITEGDQSIYKAYLIKLYPSSKILREDENEALDYAKAFKEEDKKSLSRLSEEDKNLLSSIRDGDIESIKKLKIDFDTLAIKSANNRNFIGWMHALHQKKIADHCFKERVLIAKKNKSDANLLFMVAVMFNQHMHVRGLLAEDKIDVNVTIGNGTALMYAASYGLRELTRKLCLHPKIKINTAGCGYTALDHAVMTGNLDIVKYLCAQPGIQINKANNQVNLTALEMALAYGVFDIANYLLKHPAIEISDNILSKLLDADPDLFATAVSVISDINTIFTYLGKINAPTIIYYAEHPFHDKLISGMEALKDINNNLHNVWGIFRDVIEMARTHNFYAKIRGLKASTNILDQFTIIAAQKNLLDIIKKISMVPNQNINTATVDGFTALHMAASQGHLDVVKYLCEQGIDIDAINKDKFTALHLAAKTGHLDVVKCLLAQGPKRNDILTSFHVALDNNQYEVAKYLVTQDIKIDADFLLKALKCDPDVFAASLAVISDKNIISSYLDEINAKFIVFNVTHPLHDRLIAGFEALKDKNDDLYKMMNAYHTQRERTRILFLSESKKVDQENKAINFTYSELLSKPENKITDRDQGIYLATLQKLYPERASALVKEDDADYAKALKEEEDKSVYGLLDYHDKELLSWIKDGNLQAISRMNIDYSALRAKFVNNRSFISWIHAFDHQHIADYFYKKVETEYKESSSVPLIHWAVMFNQEDAVQTLLANNKANAVCGYGYTPLIIAAQHGLLELTKKLSMHPNININAMNYAKDTALHHAAMSGDTKCLSALIKAKADINAKNGDGDTALILSSAKGHIACVNILLEKRAQIDIKGKNNCTALIQATHNSNKECIWTLIQAKANVDYRGNTLSGCSQAMVKVLEVANIHNILDKKPGIIHDTLYNGEAVALRNAMQCNDEYVVPLIYAGIGTKALINDETPLMFAARNGKKEFVAALTDQLSVHDIHNQNSQGKTAAEIAKEYGHDDIADALTLIAYAGKEQRIVKTVLNEGKNAALLQSARQGNDACITALLAAKADINHQEDKNGYTALMLAAEHNKANSVEILRANGAEIDVINIAFKNAAELAEERGYDDIAEALTSGTRLLPDTIRNNIAGFLNIVFNPTENNKWKLEYSRGSEMIRLITDSICYEYARGLDDSDTDEDSNAYDKHSLSPLEIQKQIFKEFKVSPQSELLGFTEEFLKYLRGCDIFLMSSQNHSEYKTSCKNNLYLYKQANGEIVYKIQDDIIQLENNNEKISKDIKDILRFDQQNINPFKCTSESISLAILNITSKRGHTYLRTQIHDHDHKVGHFYDLSDNGRKCIFYLIRKLFREVTKAGKNPSSVEELVSDYLQIYQQPKEAVKAQEDKPTPLMDAARNGDIESVKKLITENADINIKNAQGKTAAQLADELSKNAGDHHRCIADALNIANIISTEEKQKNDSEALIVTSILDNNINSALRISASVGYDECVKKLLGMQADVNAKRSGRPTALMQAARYSFASTVKILLAAKANIKDKADDNGNTALDLAKKVNNNVTVIAILEEAEKQAAKEDDKNNANSEDKEKKNTDDYLATMQVSDDEDDNDVKAEKDKPNVNTPLMDAACNGDIESVKKLITENADINAKNAHGKTAAELADKLSKGAGDNHQRIANALNIAYLAINADLSQLPTEAISNVLDGKIDSALISLVRCGLNNCVAKLIKMGAKVNATSNGYTVLMYAALKGYEDCIDLLLNAGAEVDTRDEKRGRTALMYAALYGHEKCVTKLLDAKAKIDAKDTELGFTALMCAAASKNHRINTLKTLLAAKANVDVKNDNNKTALEEANHEDKEIIEALKKAIEEKNASSSKFITSGTDPLFSEFCEIVSQLAPLNVCSDSSSSDNFYAQLIRFCKDYEKLYSSRDRSLAITAIMDCISIEMTIAKQLKKNMLRLLGIMETKECLDQLQYELDEPKGESKDTPANRKEDVDNLQEAISLSLWLEAEVEAEAKSVRIVKRKRIVIFCDFDGTLTGLGGNEVISSEFYRSLTIEACQNSKFDFRKCNFIPSLEVKIAEKLSSNPNLSKFMVDPDAIKYLEHVLNNSEAEVEFCIASKNRTQYIKAMLEASGLNRKLIDKIAIYSVHESKLEKSQIVTQARKNSPQPDCIFIFDDVSRDFEDMKNAAVEKYSVGVSINGACCNGAGKYNWKENLADFMQITKDQPSLDEQPRSNKKIGCLDGLNVSDIEDKDNNEVRKEEKKSIKNAVEGEESKETKGDGQFVTSQAFSDFRRIASDLVPYNRIDPALHSAYFLMSDEDCFSIDQFCQDYGNLNDGEKRARIQSIKKILPAYKNIHSNMLFTYLNEMENDIPQPINHQQSMTSDELLKNASIDEQHAILERIRQDNAIHANTAYKQAVKADAVLSGSSYSFFAGPTISSLSEEEFKPDQKSILDELIAKLIEAKADINTVKRFTQ